MTWNMVASGNASNDEAEQELVADLKAAFAKHGAGALASGFNGETHRGPLHGDQPEPEAEPETDAGDAE